MRLFAGDLWVPTKFGDPNIAYQQFLGRARPIFKRFVESVFLYDQVTVPTQDYLSLAILVGVLGERAVLEALEADVLRFARVRGGFAYMGNGGGLRSFKVRHETGEDSAFSGSVEHAIEWALSGLNTTLKETSLPRRVAAATAEIDADAIFERVRSETYADVIGDEQLLRELLSKSPDLDHLDGIEPNGVRIFGGVDGAWNGDAIDHLMALAASNLELILQQNTRCDDSSTVSPVGQLLKSKALRTLGRDNFESYLDFSEISDLPDIGEAVLEKQVSVGELIELAQSRDGALFREWFHKHCRTDPVTTGREYARLLEAVPAVQSFTGRGIRFIATTLLGLNPLAGLVASVVDSFFAERLLQGHSPKFFVEKLTSLIPE